MIDKGLRICVRRHAISAYGYIAIALGSRGFASFAEAGALPAGQDATNHVLICCAKRAVNGGVGEFPLGNQPFANGFNDFVKFPAFVATEGKPVANQQANQKREQADKAGGADAKKVAVHFAILFWFMSFMLGMAIGHGPARY